MQKITAEKIVPDTSIIVEGLLSFLAQKKMLSVKEVIVHEAVLAELEHQANKGKATGAVGLDELQALHELAKKGVFTLRFAGKRPGPREIEHADLGEVDAVIRDLAWEEDAELVTADKVQAHAAKAKGLKVLFVPKEESARKKLKIEEYFDEQTMSVHLRENVVPMAKKGIPGEWKFLQVGNTTLTADEIKTMSREILEEARARKDSFVEIEREGSTVAQVGNYRIVITKPPLSDGWEITVVRPIKKLAMQDYQLTEKLKKRVAEQAEGVLIAGSPGQGKTTFAQALAEHFAAQGKIVKTVEAPRDLVLPETITQLAISRGTPEEIHDILLLSRPDHTVFDEMRNTPDFTLFTDLRLAGVGMVGVVHAQTPLDAIQRFIGRIELGVIPHVIDTVVFIKNGKISQVLSIAMMVKVPSGMTEADLARPVVVVSDFETGKLVAEIYSYGEETVVIPVTAVAEKQTGIKQLAARAIERTLQKYADHIQVEVSGEDRAVVYVPEKFIGGLIGKEGKTIARIEEELGVHLDVREMSEIPKNKPAGNSIPFEFDHLGKRLEFFLGDERCGRDVSLYVNGAYIASFAVGKKGVVKINQDNQLGKTVMDAVRNKERIEFYG